MLACSGDEDTAATTTEPPPPPETTAPPTTEPPGERLAVFDLGPGECFDQRGFVDGEEEAVAWVRVDCSLPHQFEVFARDTHPAEPGAPYPTDQELRRYLTDLCFLPFEGYVGAPYELSEIEVGTMTPSPDTWAAGDRSFVCYLQPPGGEKVSGSLQGSGL